VTFNRRSFVIAAAMLAIAGSISPSFAAAQGTGDPKATVQAFYDTLEETMKQGEELGFDGRYKKLDPVIHQTFDVPVMAKIAIGTEWTVFTADEKTRMLDAFGRYMVTTYAARFKSYKGQKFEVGEVKQPAENRTLVETKLIRSNGDPVALNYLFRPDVDGHEDHRHGVAAAADGRQDRQPAAILHADVKDQEIRLIRLQTREGFIHRASAEDDVMAVRTQELHHAVKEDRVIVDYCYLSHHVCDLCNDKGNLMDISEFMLKLWK